MKTAMDTPDYPGCRRTDRRALVKLGAGTLYRSIQRMLEQDLLIETESPDPESDDERRRYYRITPFGRKVAQAEARRLSQMVKLAQRSGFVAKA